eukprot:5948842-Lingulodinium_polyedra.AAC.1
MKHDYDGRWRCVFRSPMKCLPGKSASWTSRGSCGEALALKEVLEAVWKQWCDYTGMECPHT